MDALSKQLKATKRSFNRLAEALTKNVKKDEMYLDATIQRFEFSFENLWKLAKMYLKEFHGLDCYSPRKCFALLFKIGDIDNEDFWLEVLENRNLTVHTYQENIAVSVYNFVKNNFEKMQEFVERIEKNINCHG